MRQIKISDRIRYWFDNTMSKGTAALIFWLFVLSAGMIAIVSWLVVWIGVRPPGMDDLTFGEAAWMSLMRTLDAGTMGGDEGWSFRMPMLLITFGGIFVVSMLIGVLTTGLESKLEELRKGRSLVVEENHTVILGWSHQIFSILSELVVANQNQHKPCIAILADKDKVEMEDEIKSRIGRCGNTRLVCRTGNPISLTDLEIVNPYSARSIIVLAPEGTDDPDSHVIKTILALMKNRHQAPQPLHIVAEIRDSQNVEVARMVGGEEVQLIQSDELIARITAQTCRQSGLSVIYTELLDFGGDEIYFCQEPGLTGKTFGEAMLAFEDSAVIGLAKKNRLPKLHPPVDTLIEAGDKLIAVSEDDDTIRLSWLNDVQIDPRDICQPQVRTPQPERTLILGWNRRGTAILHELDHYLAAGSEAVVAATLNQRSHELSCDCDQLENLKVIFLERDTTSRRQLNALDIPSFQHVILLSCSDGFNSQEADARTLVTLLHLRDIAEKHGGPFSIVSEMLNIQNRELADITRADDFIVSDKLISLILSQVSENKNLKAVFQDLFNPEGSELYLKPAGDYVVLGKPVNFYTVVEAGRQRNEVPLGYRLWAEANQPDKQYGVYVNPKKSEKVVFEEHDRIIVLAEG